MHAKSQHDIAHGAKNELEDDHNRHEMKVGWLELTCDVYYGYGDPSKRWDSLSFTKAIQDQGGHANRLVWKRCVGFSCHWQHIDIIVCVRWTFKRHVAFAACVWLLRKRDISCGGIKCAREKCWYLNGFLQKLRKQRSNTTHSNAKRACFRCARIYVGVLGPLFYVRPTPIDWQIHSVTLTHECHILFIYICVEKWKQVWCTPLPRIDTS